MYIHNNILYINTILYYTILVPTYNTEYQTQHKDQKHHDNLCATRSLKKVRKTITKA